MKYYNRLVNSNYVTYVFIPQTQNQSIVSWIADETAFKEGNVKNWWIIIDELEDKDFKGQIIIKLSLCSMHLWKTTYTKWTNTTFRKIIKLVYVRYGNL